jgi:CubicO group peptidase (beta-lactamase class C family)
MRLAIFALALLSAAPAAAKLDTAAIDRAATAILADTRVPTASIAIVQGGRIVYTHAYGAGARTTARYRIASVSKQFTATAILMLADEGWLTLDDPVGRYLPGLTGADRITIRQLLNHTAGYRDYWPQDYPFAAMAQPVAPAEILDRWAKAPLDFAPGSQWQYSNTGYVAAGLIAEKVSGEPLMRLIQTRILDPLHLTSAVDADTGMTVADARPHHRYALGPVRPEAPAAPGWLYAAGPLAMTAADLARWDIAMIDRTLLSPAGYAAQRTPVITSAGRATDYGLGIEIDTVAGHRRLHHGGEAVGFLSENRIYPDDKAAIVVLVDGDFGDAEVAIADRIEAAILPETDGSARARAILAMLRAGRIDRTRFTANGNAYFTPVALADFKASLARLGAVTAVTQRSSSLRGGFTEMVYDVRTATRALTLVLRAEPGVEGRIEQFTVSPAS